MHSACTHRQPHIKTSFRGLVPAEILQLATDRRESHVFCFFFFLLSFPVRQPCVFSDRYCFFFKKNKQQKTPSPRRDNILTGACLLAGLLFFFMCLFCKRIKGRGGDEKKANLGRIVGREGRKPEEKPFNYPFGCRNLSSLCEIRRIFTPAFSLFLRLSSRNVNTAH